MQVWQIILLIIVLYNAATIGVGALFFLFKAQAVSNFLIGIWLTPYFWVMRLVNANRIRSLKKRFVLVYCPDSEDPDALYRMSKQDYEAYRANLSDPRRIIPAEDKTDDKFFLPLYSKEYKD